MNNTKENNIYWVDRHGDKIPLDEMDTPYLYNVVKMIWNNHLAPNHSFGDVIHWNFIQPPHTPKFLNNFFQVGFFTLKIRSDNKIAKKFIIHVDSFGENFEKARKSTIRELIDDASDFPLND